MEDTDIDEEVFDAAVCPECTKMTEHEILRRNVKGNGEDLLVRCVVCSNVHNLQLRPPKSVFIKTTLSDRMDSELSLIEADDCLLYTSPSPRDQRGSRMPSSA